MLVLILGLMMSGAVGIGSTTAYAGNDDSQSDSSSQGEDGDFGFNGQ